MVATPTALLVQVPPLGLHERVVLEPLHIAAVPPIFPGSALINCVVVLKHPAFTI